MPPIKYILCKGSYWDLKKIKVSIGIINVPNEQEKNQMFEKIALIIFNKV